MKLKSSDLMNLRNVIDQIKICIIDASAEDQLAGIPMSNLVLNEEGSLCFYCDQNEQEFNRDTEIFLTYADPVNKFLYATSGKAYLKKQSGKTKNLGQTMLKIESMELEDEGLTSSNGFNLVRLLKAIFN